MCVSCACILVACRPLRDAFGLHTTSGPLPYPAKSSTSSSAAGGTRFSGDDVSGGGHDSGTHPQDIDFDVNDYGGGQDYGGQDYGGMDEPTGAPNPPSPPPLIAGVADDSAAAAAAAAVPEAAEPELGAVSDAHMPVSGSKWHPRTVDALRSLNVALKSEVRVGMRDMLRAVCSRFR
jgi:hypothetical protein